MHPVAQRLPIHAPGLCGQPPRRPIQPHGNRQKGRRACLASAVRAASARNCELRSWWVISIADMLQAPRINDMRQRVTFAAVWESPRSQVLGRLV